MKRIAFFLGDIHGTGGISRVTYIVSNQLSEYYDVSVLACSNNKDIKYNYSNKVKTDYLFEERKPVHTRFFQIVNGIRSYVKNHDIDIFICAGAIFFPTAVLALAGLKTRLVCWEHSNVSVSNEYKFQKTCRRIGAIFANRIVVLTKSDKTMYEKKYHVDNCVCINNPVDDRLIIKVDYDINSKQIISVGRLCYQKNFERLVDIAKVVLEKHQDWQWHIYGDGENRNTIEKKIREAGLRERLVLMGNVPDLYTRYKEYSFLVMTSRFEGFPMTLLESTANGIPSIAFDVLTGPSEIIENGSNGFLIDQTDDAEMIEKINELIASEELRMRFSDRCLEIRERFRCINIVRQWIEFLNGV